jgi:hypothetical protein
MNLSIRSVSKTILTFFAQSYLKVLLTEDKKGAASAKTHPRCVPRPFFQSKSKHTCMSVISRLLSHYANP